MFPIGLISLFLINIIRMCNAQIYIDLHARINTPILCPKQSEHFWKQDPQVCDPIRWEQTNKLLYASIDVGGIFITPGNLLTESEKIDYDLLTDITETVIYHKPPKKIADQASPEVRKGAQTEVKRICDAYVNNEFTLEDAQLHEDGCVELPLNTSNPLFDGTKYPFLHQFMQHTRQAIGARFACLNILADDLNFHVDGTNIVSINSDPRISTYVIPSAPMPTINFERFKLKDRLSRTLKWENKHITPEQLEDIVKKAQAKMNVAAADYAMTKHLDNATPPLLQYLPSGEIYALDFAIHNGPVASDATETGCRVTFFN